MSAQVFPGFKRRPNAPEMGGSDSDADTCAGSTNGDSLQTWFSIGRVFLPPPPYSFHGRYRSAMV